jgi:hypothetical protein
MRARNPSNSKVLSSTAKRSLGPVKQSSYAYRLCVQEATTSTTIFTRTFLRDRSLQSKRLDNLRARDAHQGEENPDHRCDRHRWLSADRAIHNDPEDQPPVERRSRGTPANQIASQGSLLRLSFQRNPVALVYLHRSGLMIGRARCRARTPRTEFLGVGILLCHDAKTKTAVDGQSVERRNHATLDLSHTASRHWPHAERLDGAGTMDRGGNSQPTGEKIGV